MARIDKQGDGVTHPLWRKPRLPRDLLRIDVCISRSVGKEPEDARRITVDLGCHE
jgi:hypothetical protein